MTVHLDTLKALRTYRRNRNNTETQTADLDELIPKPYNPLFEVAPISQCLQPMSSVLVPHIIILSPQDNMVPLKVGGLPMAAVAAQQVQTPLL